MSVKFMYADDYKFTVMWKNVAILRVELRKNSREVRITQFTEGNIVSNPFYGGPVDVERVYDFLCSRLMDPARTCLPEYLERYQEPEFNPYALVQKTHGVMWEDYMWLKFEQDKELCWEDVKIRD